MESNFSEFNQKNPCADCPAPCCQMQLIPYKTPATFMDMDFIHYMLLFPRTEVAVASNGEWSIIRWEACREFDVSAHVCRLHNTSMKPQTCAMYNPYNCWYKKCFVLNGSHRIYRMDLARFEVWVNELQFAEDGQITDAPDFERSLSILKGMPIEPCLEPVADDATPSDARLAAVEK